MVTQTFHSMLPDMCLNSSVYIFALKGSRPWVCAQTCAECRSKIQQCPFCRRDIVQQNVNM